MSKQKTNLKYQIRAIVFQTLLHILARFSLRANQRVGSFIGWLASIFPNRNQRITQVNIRRCYPELTPQQQQQLVNKSLLETGKTTTEVAAMWLWDTQKIIDTIKQVSGEKLLNQAYQSKQGVILAFPHLGNWELVSLYCASRYPMTTLYQPPKITPLDKMIRQGRERTGAKLVATDNSGVRALLAALKKGEMIGILPDQEPKAGNGEFAPFFNIPAYTGTLVSRMTNKTNAKVIFAYAKRLTNGEGYHLFFKPAVDDISSEILLDSLKGLNQGVENCVRELPEQYQWSYYRFRTRPAGEEKFYK